MHAFTTTALFQYNKKNKRRFALFLYGTLALLIIIAASYFLFFKHQDIWFFSAIEELVEYFSIAISSGSALGVFYVAFLGALIFPPFPFPLEPYFVLFLARGVNPYLAILVYLAGLMLSFTINYFLGLKLDSFAKKVIAPKQFYKIKGFLNHYGVYTIIVINLVPFLPAQPLSTILGVFRYNKAKFYLYSFIGLFLKFTIIALGYIYIFTPT